MSGMEAIRRDFWTSQGLPRPPSAPIATEDGDIPWQNDAQLGRLLDMLEHSAASGDLAEVQMLVPLIRRRLDPQRRQEPAQAIAAGSTPAERDEP